jgi:hypothetical protein
MNKKDLKRLSLITLTHGATRCARLSARLFVMLLVLIACVPARLVRAQSCNPAVVSYIVRDENGKALDEAALKSVYEELPKSIGDARVYVGETAFADDGKTFYWPESVDWPKGEKVIGLQFINAETCTMHLTEVTLTYHHKKMRLIFNLEITRAQADRRPVIGSLPFQEGSFALDLTGWSHDRDQMIPPERWKKVKD